MITGGIADLGHLTIDGITALGDMTLFALRTFSWTFFRMPRWETLLPSFYQVGVLSLPVVALTGTFIGMVLAVQSYWQFHSMGMETRMGAVINVALVRELGPVSSSNDACRSRRGCFCGGIGNDAGD